MCGLAGGGIEEHSQSQVEKGAYCKNPASIYFCSFCQKECSIGSISCSMRLGLSLQDLQGKAA